jgi:hypothetical protein
MYSVRLADGREFGPAGLNTIQQWAREGRIPIDALLVARTAASGQAGEVRSVLSEPSLRMILQAPPTVPTGLVQPPTSPSGGALSGMIPYKNPPALIGYYLGIASLIPGVGIAAFILGIIGFRKRLKDPSVRGMAHAWIAIILGGLMTLVWTLVILSFIVSN